MNKRFFLLLIFSILVPLDHSEFSREAHMVTSPDAVGDVVETLFKTLNNFDANGVEVLMAEIGCKLHFSCTHDLSRKSATWVRLVSGVLHMRRYFALFTAHSPIHVELLKTALQQIVKLVTFIFSPQKRRP